MKKILFNKENLFKVELFTGGKITFYHNLNKPEATLKLNSLNEENKTVDIKLEEGDILYKNNKGIIFKQLN